jgi:hypothetical protein
MDMKQFFYVTGETIIDPTAIYKKTQLVVATSICQGKPEIGSNFKSEAHICTMTFYEQSGACQVFMTDLSNKQKIALTKHFPPRSIKSPPSHLPLHAMAAACSRCYWLALAAADQDRAFRGHL